MLRRERNLYSVGYLASASPFPAFFCSALAQMLQLAQETWWAYKHKITACVFRQITWPHGSLLPSGSHQCTKQGMVTVWWEALNMQGGVCACPRCVRSWGPGAWPRDRAGSGWKPNKAALFAGVQRGQLSVTGGLPGDRHSLCDAQPHTSAGRRGRKELQSSAERKLQGKHVQTPLLLWKPKAMFPFVLIVTESVNSLFIGCKRCG